MYLTDVNGPCGSAVPRPAAKRKPSVANGPKSAVPPTGVEVRRIGLLGESDKRTTATSPPSEGHPHTPSRVASVYGCAGECLGARWGRERTSKDANRREIARGDER